MQAIVRLALSRPLTPFVLAILILIFGPLAALNTPTDIFPDIRIPVIAVVWTYRGLSPDDMAGRVIYYYERQLSSTVNDIEHIESQSLPGIGIVKIFFQPGVDIRTATAQVTSHLADGAEADAARHHPAADPQLQRLDRADPAAGAFQPAAVRAAAVRPRPELHPARAGHGAGRGDPLALWRQGAPDPGRPRSRRRCRPRACRPQDVANALAAQNQIIPAGTTKIGSFEYNVKLNNSPEAVDELNDLPIKTVNGATIYMRDVAHVRDGFAAAAQRGARGWPPRGADDRPEERLGLDPRRSSTASRRRCRSIAGRRCRRR